MGEGMTLFSGEVALVTGGGYAEYCNVPAGQCLPTPENLSFTDAASLPETFFTVWSNVFDRGNLKDKESLLVHGGSSGIGGARGRKLRRDVTVEYRRPDMIEPAFEIGPDLTANVGPALAEREVFAEIGAVLGNHAFEQRIAIVARDRGIDRMVSFVLKLWMVRTHLLQGSAPYQ